MTNTHIIAGYGNWGKKIALFCKKNKLFDKIIIFTRTKRFQYFPILKKISKKELATYFLQSSSVHICSSDNSHIRLLKRFNLSNKSIIVEKPFFSNNSDYQNTKNEFKNKNIIVNYIDLFNPHYLKVAKFLDKKHQKNSNVKILYSYSKKKNQNLFDFFESYIDHPLAIILNLLNHFSLKREIFIENKNTLNIQYFYSKIKINIIIKNSKLKKRLIILDDSKRKVKINFLNHHMNKSSFHNLYHYLLNKTYKNKFSLKFNKKIYKEKNSVLSNIKNQIN